MLLLTSTIEEWEVSLLRKKIFSYSTHVSDILLRYSGYVTDIQKDIWIQGFELESDIAQYNRISSSDTVWLETISDLSRSEIAPISREWIFKCCLQYPSAILERCNGFENEVWAANRALSAAKWFVAPGRSNLPTKQGDNCEKLAC